MNDLYQALEMEFLKQNVEHHLEWKKRFFLLLNISCYFIFHKNLFVENEIIELISLPNLANEYQNTTDTLFKKKLEEYLFSIPTFSLEDNQNQVAFEHHGYVLINVFSFIKQNEEFINNHLIMRNKKKLEQILPEIEEDKKVII